MAHAVAPYARSHYVLCRVVTTILLSDQVFRRALQMLCLSQAYPVLSSEIGRVTFPNWKRAIEASTVLPNESLAAESLEFIRVHGNSLGLTSKSP